MHATISLSLFARAARELWPGCQNPSIKRVQCCPGFHDPFLPGNAAPGAFRGRNRQPFVRARDRPSLATHLVRTYRDDGKPAPSSFHLASHVSTAPGLEDGRFAQYRAPLLLHGIHVGKLAAAVKMSQSHFSHLFNATPASHLPSISSACGCRKPRSFCVRQRSPSARSACRPRLPQGNRDQSPRVSGENAGRRARGKF